MNLTKQEIAFLITYSQVGRFSSSLDTTVNNLLNEGMIERWGHEVRDGNKTEYYKVSNFGHMMVDKIINLTLAYSVEAFKIEKPPEEWTIAIGTENPSSQEYYNRMADNPVSIGPKAGKVAEALSDDQIAAAKSDNSHYAEEVDEATFYYNDDAYNWVPNPYYEEE